MKKKLAEYGDVSVKINESEFKIEMAAREIERLNNILENKNREIKELQGQCAEG